MSCRYGAVGSLVLIYSEKSYHNSQHGL